MNAEDKEEYRAKFIDPMFPGHVTAWRLCVTAGPALYAELSAVAPAEDEQVLHEGSKKRCLEVFAEAQQHFRHAGDGRWCLRQVRLEPYGSPVALEVGP